MGQGNSLLRNIQRERPSSQRQASISSAFEQRQRSGLRRLRRTSSSATAQQDYKRPCPGNATGTGDISADAGFGNPAEQGSLSENESGSKPLRRENEFTHGNNSIQEADEENETVVSHIVDSAYVGDNISNVSAENPENPTENLTETLLTSGNNEGTALSADVGLQLTPSQSATPSPLPVNIHSSYGTPEIAQTAQAGDDDDDEEDEDELFYDADMENPEPHIYTLLEAHEPGDDENTAGNPQTHPLPPAFNEEYRGSDNGNNYEETNYEANNYAENNYEEAQYQTPQNEQAERQIMPPFNQSHDFAFHEPSILADGRIHNTHSERARDVVDRIVRNLTRAQAVPNTERDTERPGLASLLEQPLSNNDRNLNASSAQSLNTPEVDRNSQHHPELSARSSLSDAQGAPYYRYPDVYQSSRNRGPDHGVHAVANNFAPQNTEEQNEPFLNGRNPSVSDRRSRQASLSSESSQNDMPNEEQIEEERLVSQLSRTLFTAVLLIASHAVNTSNNARAAAENGTNNRGETANSEGARPGESFREEVTRRIWNALHDHTAGRGPTPSNPVYSQSNLPHLEEIRTLNGESFLSFMDQLWDGSLNRELSSALGGNDAFFRIFRFPRDSENRFPVLVLRVTSVVDRNTFQQRPQNDEDANETTSRNGNNSEGEDHEYGRESDSGGSSEEEDHDYENSNFGDVSSDLRRSISSSRRTEIAANESANNERRHNLFDDASSDSEDDLFVSNNQTTDYYDGDSERTDNLNQMRGYNWDLRRHAGGYAGHHNAWLQEASSAIRRERDRRVHLEGLALSQREREEANARRRAEARANAERARRNAAAQNNSNLRPNRSWITYVVRGSFPETHPIFSAPSLMTNHPTDEDMELLDQLFLPGKSPSASQDDIDHAGGVFEVEEDSDLLGERCPVCLVDYEEGDICRRLKCSHSFHKECVDSWLLRSHNSCPMCRQEGVPLHMRERTFSPV